MSSLTSFVCSKKKKSITLFDVCVHVFVSSRPPPQNMDIDFDVILESLKDKEETMWEVKQHL